MTLYKSFGLLGFTPSAPGRSKAAWDDFTAHTVTRFRAGHSWPHPPFGSLHSAAPNWKLGRSVGQGTQTSDEASALFRWAPDFEGPPQRCGVLPVSFLGALRMTLERWKLSFFFNGLFLPILKVPVQENFNICICVPSGSILSTPFLNLENANNDKMMMMMTWWCQEIVKFSEEWKYKTEKD